MNEKNPGPDRINHNNPVDTTAAPLLRTFPTVDVLGVPVVRITTTDYIRNVTQAATTSSAQPQSNSPLFVTYLNAACSNIAADDQAYREILHQADCVYADGQAIVWAARALGSSLPERVNAGDFIVQFCEAMASQGLKLGLVGGRPGVAANAAATWLSHVPRLQISGTWNGFFEDTETILAAIKNSNTDILLVGMGAPLQEKWAWENRAALGVKVIWCVGALFEYYGEGRARAPVWMRRAGLEWLFRLALEPRRLWHRYLVGNFRFIRRLRRETKQN